MSGNLILPDTRSAARGRLSAFAVEIENTLLSGVVLRELTRATLESGKVFRFTAHGYSMAPFIRNGDVITIVPHQCAPRIGDVLAFVNPDTQRLIVHRVIARAGGGYVLKGDNVSEPDGVMRESQLLGRVARVERAGKPVRGVLGAAGRGIALLSRWNLPCALRQASHIPRRIAGKVLRRVQALAVYPGLVRPWSPLVNIIEAGDADLVEVRQCLLPGVWRRPPPPDLNVTCYLAKVDAGLAGSVKLVRHPPEPGRDVGYWLDSLYVWTRYRRLGIGERLTLQVMAQARIEGAAQLRVLVNEANASEIGLFGKLGFVRIAPPAIDRPLAREAPPRRILMSVRLTERPEAS